MSNVIFKYQIYYLYNFFLGLGPKHRNWTSTCNNKGIKGIIIIRVIKGKDYGYGLSSTVIWWKVVYTLYRYPVRHKGTWRHLGQKSTFINPVNLTIRFLDCVRKLEFQERNHICTRRPCKCYIERPHDRFKGLMSHQDLKKHVFIFSWID